ncbi:hypothetical protein D7Y41_30310 [Anaerotruncus sp. 1XD22-93]|nr:hypothetical protein D7Y41_30310 [Anaerotruncus sp. 1XD22-93]
MQHTDEAKRPLAYSALSFQNNILRSIKKKRMSNQRSGRYALLLFVFWNLEKRHSSRDCFL